MYFLKILCISYFVSKPSKTFKFCEFISDMNLYYPMLSEQSWTILVNMHFSVYVIHFINRYIIVVYLIS